MRTMALSLLLACAAPCPCTQQAPDGSPAKPDAQGLPTLEEVRAQLAQHARAVIADDGGLACWTCSGTIGSGDQQSRIRLFVRREPFACRREIEPPAGPTTVTITDGHLAWDGSGRPLSAEAAWVCLEDAFVDGLLYLDPSHVSGLPGSHEPVQQPDYPGLPADVPRGLRTHLFAADSPAGSVLQLHLDLDCNALREVVTTPPAVVRWHRFGGERRFGPLTLPMVRASGRADTPASVEVRRWTEVVIAASLPQTLFDGCPLPVTPPLQRAGRFEVVPHTLPGAVHFELPVVTVNDRHATRAMLDTGCSDVFIARELASALRLPPRRPMDLQSFGRQTLVQQPKAWLDALAIGDRQLLQRSEPVTALGIVNQAPADRQLGLLIGLSALQDSPVLDFVRGELTCRGTPVAPLAATPGAAVITVPLTRRDSRLYYVTIEVNGTRVEAMLDTGTPLPLRLSRAVLQRCGLPTESATWLAAGGGHLTAASLGQRWRDVVAPMPSWKLGSVTFEQSLAILGGLDDDEPQQWDAIVGAGALVAFARVGFDLQRGRLELDPGEGLPGDVVPPAGQYLGLGLATPAAATPARILGLPTITEVAAGSPAARAGLAQLDRIWSIGGSPCAGLTAGEVNRRLWLRAGEVVEFEVLGRDGSRRTVRLP